MRNQENCIKFKKTTNNCIESDHYMICHVKTGIGDWYTVYEIKRNGGMKMIIPLKKQYQSALEAKRYVESMEKIKAKK